MRILVTHELFPPDVVGGGERLTLKFTKLLKENGHEVKVVTSGDPKIEDYDGIPTVRVPMNRYLMNLSLRTILREAKEFDIIQTSSGNMAYPSWLAAKILKKPISCHIHHIFGSYWRDVRGPVLGKVFEIAEKAILKRSYDSIVFQNFNSKRIGLDMGINEEITHMIQPGINWKKYQSNFAKEPFVLFVGNFSMDKPTVNIKGMKYLIDAAKQLPDINFVIVGGGSEINRIRSTKKQNNLVFTGPLTRGKLMELYGKALIFCYPSLTEGFGISLLEAMASGCATITTIDIGQDDMRIRPKNVDDIVENVNYLIENVSQAKRIGKKNNRYAKTFTWKKFIKNYIELFESII